MPDGALFVADQVILAKVAAGFNGNQGNGQAAGVFQSVRLTEGNMDSFALTQETRADVGGDLGGAFDDDPVCRAMQVGVQRGGFARGKTD